MRDLETVISEFKEVVQHPGKQVDKYAAEGKKMVGCIPYFYPEELVTACVMVPIGLWGAEMEVTKAKAYWPAFICSMLQTVLEQGMSGQLDKLSAVIIPLACDSMKNMRLNWSCGVPHIPFIDMPMAQNRKLAGGIRYTTATPDSDIEKHKYPVHFKQELLDEIERREQALIEYWTNPNT